MASMKPNGTWIARVRTPDGERISRTFATRALAEGWEDQAKRAIAQRRPPPDPRDARKTLGTFVEENVGYVWADSKNLHKQRQQAQLLVDLLGADRDVSRITKADATAARQSLQARGLAGSTLNNYAATFNRLLAHAEDLSLVETAVRMAYAKQRKGRVRFLTEMEEKRLLDSLRHLGQFHYATMVDFLLATGARWGEVRSLEDTAVALGPKPQATFWDTKDGGFRSFPLIGRAVTSYEEALVLSPVTGRPWPLAYGRSLATR